MPERLDPVRMVKVGVQAKDLAEAGLYVAVERLWETGALAKPVAACELREGRCGGRGTCRDWSVGAGAVETTGSVGRGAAGDVVGGEGFGVIHLSDDPALDEGDVLACWHLDGDFLVIEPGVSVTPRMCQRGLSPFGPKSLPASRHDGTVGRIANSATRMCIDVLNALEQCSYQAILFHPCRRGTQSSLSQHYGSEMCTLMSQPLGNVHVLRLSSQRHEVAPDTELRILLAEEELGLFFLLRFALALARTLVLHLRGGSVGGGSK